MSEQKVFEAPEVGIYVKTSRPYGEIPAGTVFEVVEDAANVDCHPKLKPVDGGKFPTTYNFQSFVLRAGPLVEVDAPHPPFKAGQVWQSSPPGSWQFFVHRNNWNDLGVFSENGHDYTVDQFEEYMRRTETKLVYDASGGVKF